MKRGIITENQIMESALALFVQNGYHGTSVKDITEKVGLTKGALYAHFPGKGALLLRIIDEFRKRFIDEMERVVSRTDTDAVGRLHRAISFSAKFAIDNPHLCVFLTFLTTELSADIDFVTVLKKVYEKYQAVISQVIRDGIAEGAFRKDLDPSLTALSFMAMHDGMLHQWILNKPVIDGRAFIRTFREIFMQGLIQ